MSAAVRRNEAGEGEGGSATGERSAVGERAI